MELVIRNPPVNTLHTPDLKHAMAFLDPKACRFRIKHDQPHRIPFDENDQTAELQREGQTM